MKMKIPSKKFLQRLAVVSALDWNGKYSLILHDDPGWLRRSIVSHQQHYRNHDVER